MTAKLHIGNRNYSSWSMRPWLALKWSGIAFTDEVRPLSRDIPGMGQGRAAPILEVSPSGRVPALHVDGVVINDSLAICEWAAEKAPSLWPADANMRALARAATAEMHSGFMGLRRDLPMNVKRRLPAKPVISDDAERDLERLFALWRGARERFGAGGPYLFGARSIADAFYTPVAARLRTYAISSPGVIDDYVATLLSDAAFLEWEKGALTEPWAVQSWDEIYA
jgi:glutathione S-transferase